MRNHPAVYEAHALASASPEIQAEIDGRLAQAGCGDTAFSIYCEIIARDGVWVGETETKALALCTFSNVTVVRVWRDAETGQVQDKEDCYRPESMFLAQHNICLLQTPNHFDQLVERYVGGRRTGSRSWLSRGTASSACPACLS